MPRHALLSASSSHRWLNCPPSLRLSENYEDTVSEYALEGTDAHTLCEYRLSSALHRKAKNPIEDLSYYNEEMEECAENYVLYILEILETVKKACKDPLILIEQRLDYSKYAKGGFGTGDCVIAADDTLYVIDYKHGKGVEVKAKENSQMMLYALGALGLFDGIYDIEKIKMVIFQPRKNNISTFEMSKDALYKWADTDLKEKAELAYKGKGEFKSGEWCRFCKARFNCRKRAETNLEALKYEFKEPDTLEDDEIEDILGKIDELVSFAADIKDFALKRALQGKKWTAYKLVLGRSNRRYVDSEMVAKVVTENGYEPYEKKLLGITAMEKMLGKTKFNEVLKGLVEKPDGKPTLVGKDDKRPEINSAREDFNKMEESNNGK